MNTILSMPRGGKREGSGRPPLDPSGERRWPVTIMLTKKEEARLRDLLAKLRAQPVEPEAPTPEPNTQPENKPQAKVKHHVRCTCAICKPKTK